MFKPHQRRYLGNKQSLTAFINDSIDAMNIKYDSFVDLFAGTGSVGFSQLQKGKSVSFNDFLKCNFVVFEAFSGRGVFSLSKLEALKDSFNEKKAASPNYFSKNFGGKYFEEKDARKIGFIREEIEELFRKKKINSRERSILIASLLFSIDKIALTVGHYDAFRIGAATRSIFVFKLIDPFRKQKTVNYNLDANLLARKLDSDIVYIDPPYNSRQYGDAYHLLENLVAWEKPETFGKASKMDRKDIKSEYSMKNAIIAFETLINSINSKYIIISYNDTGLLGSGRSAAKMTDKDILRILSRRGKVSVFKKEYKAFNTGSTERKKVYERLFICKVSSKPIYLQNIKSPLNYMGGKFSIIETLKDNFPENINNFYDIFAGGLNVGINSESNKVISYETQRQLVDVLKFIKETETAKLINTIENIIKKYRLSNSSVHSYSYYGCTSSNGLSTYNKDKYIRLREDYNKTKRTDFLLVLIIYGFNNLFRFNSEGGFNTPAGKRDFNNKTKANLIAFSERLKDIVIEINNKSYDTIKISKLKKNDFVFLDPPYLITNGVYNYKNWTVEDEIKLCSFIKQLNNNGIKFMLTNVTVSGKLKNNYLLDLIDKNEFTVIKTKNDFKNSSYNKDKTKKTVEVIVKNY